ncbi:hypothetical protein KP509_36G048300 [Ceratopteris richardii]|uniref:Uncharacterized protein n=1 Tax=Ceratopteris richardii TaxID=49495 RepID=A0A8T2QE33_CERRI|nr:hypothetical protein KP509_1Z238200 [Ceratopteris richardii]KAH7281451.1 hypothetical protein KP509_36G048300 [Ceratopteris richardii]
MRMLVDSKADNENQKIEGVEMPESGAKRVLEPISTTQKSSTVHDLVKMEDQQQGVPKRNSPEDSDVEMKNESSRSFLVHMLQYADKYDVLLMILGTLGAIGDGISTPGLMVIMSGLINTFGRGTSGDPSAFMDQISKYALYFIYVGLAVGVAAFLEAATWIKTGERQSSRLRYLYLKAILRQDESYFDTQAADTADVVNIVAADTHTIQEVISEKVPHFIANLSTFIGSYVVGFYLTTRLAAISLVFIPLLVVPGLLYGRILAGLARKMHVEYNKAGAIAEQAISSIRTVYAFSGEEKTLHQYSRALQTTVQLGLKQGLAKGLAIGSNGVVFAIWAFLSWYGSNLIINEGLNGGKVIATGLTAILGGLALGNALPNLKYFMEASVAGARIFEMIERVPSIDPEDETGLVIAHGNEVKGEIEFKNVSFSYPARPKSLVIDDLTVHIPAGKTMALVGGSGSGKSTVVALVLRFYDPHKGVITLDGTPIKNFQLKSLRSMMGLVSQEPALFATTIKHNILLGKEGATMEEIIEAAKKSNAHNFISQLPEGYETQVGERGVQMSGGQKQRIAIARAMLKDPPILLLDEATSALDAESEQVVQAALDQAAIGRTTLVIAHRLSTIHSADQIAVLQNGRIIEMGHHEELSRKESSAYAALIQASRDDRKVPSADVTSIHPGPRYSSSALRKSTSSRFSTDRFEEGAAQPEDLGTVHTPSYVDSSPPSLRRLVMLNRPEWRQGLLGTLGASIFGVIQPLYAFTLGSVISAYYSTDRAKQKREIRDYSLVFTALAVACFLTNTLQHYNFAKMGERLTKRVRERLLANILRFEIGWFDRPENTTGAICGRLASEANMVRALVGDRWSLIITTIVATLTAATFGLILSWRLAVVIIVVQPLVVVCFYMRRVLIKNMSQKALGTQQQSSHLAAEAVVHHRIIAAFTSYSSILHLFETLQDDSRRSATRQAMLGGLGLSGAQITTFFSWALDFWYGGRLVSKGQVTMTELFKTFFILVSTGRVIADAGSMTSDIAKGAVAVASVFGTLDRITSINPEEDDAEEIKTVVGDIELRGIDFAYPSRPDVAVFSDFNLRVSAGKSVALVGESGSGKSTVISLILRFYDPLRGSVKIDGRDLRELQLRSLRKHMGLVSQEPALFAGSIRDNIRYGHPNGSEDEIVEAAKIANAHDFICSLAEGYDTNVGDRGVQLSGGQKQRIAIARAVVRRPSILLLDEATSALDAQAERIVQEALDRVMGGRTTVVVAHRLSTVQGCNTICALQNGRIVEAGSHAELLAKGPSGFYFNLIRLQHQTALP